MAGIARQPGADAAPDGRAGDPRRRRRKITDVQPERRGGGIGWRVGRGRGGSAGEEGPDAGDLGGGGADGEVGAVLVVALGEDPHGAPDLPDDAAEGVGDGDDGLLHVRLEEGDDEVAEAGDVVGVVRRERGRVGVLGEEGLSIVGRASNMLITGGKNVHPEEVESRLVEHGSVSECVVLGLPDPRWGEEIVAFVVSSGEGAGPDAADLRDHLKQRIASYKVPKRWFTVEAIPRTRAGKTDRSPDRLLELATEI